MTIAADPPSQRTHAARSRAARQRLIEAAIAAIDEEGFAGASVSRIVERAAMSRGGHLHHFASKDLILTAVAAHLSAGLYRRAGEALAELDDPDMRLPVLVHFLWREFYERREGRVLAELLIAARTDPGLAAHLRPIVRRMMRHYSAACRRLFVARAPETMDVDMAFRLAQWTLRGMVLDALLPRDPGFFDRQRDALIDMLSRVVAPRV